MILGFKHRFVGLIKHGVKIHTIRKGKRWRAGMTIHYYTGVRTKAMKKFMADGVVVSVQDISIKWVHKLNGGVCVIIIDGKPMPFSAQRLRLASNDGFRDYKAFEEWFNEDYSGQLIHWTTFKY